MNSSLSVIEVDGPREPVCLYLGSGRAKNERLGRYAATAASVPRSIARQMQKRIDTIPIGVMKGLTAWEWPGNIRELENFIERAVILTRGKSLQAPLSELRKRPTDTLAASAAHPVKDDIARIVKETITALSGKKDVEYELANKQREEIVRALTESKGRVGGADGAAARMGINRTTLFMRMKKLGIDPRQYV